MRIKKIHVGFDIDMEVFVQMLAHGNSGMKIDVFGADPPKSKRQAKEEPALLEGPKMTLKRTIAAFLLEHKDRAVSIGELKELSDKNGFSASSASPTMRAMIKMGVAKRVNEGLYQATAKLVNTNG
jgi:hypothetical protein